MRRFPVAVGTAVVTASLLAPSAILADESSQEPAPPVAAPQPATVQQPPDQTDLAISPPAGDSVDQESVPPVSLRTSVARDAPGGASTSAAVAASVAMQDFKFSPKTVTIDVGESIKWTNKGEAEEGHTATGDTFDSGVLKQGQTFTHKFSAAGTFDYICTLHSIMKGTIVVRASGGGDGGGSNDGDGPGRGSGNDGGSGDSGGSGAGGGSGDSGDFFDPGASGTAGSLPSTGQELGGLAIAGIDLLLAGTLLLLRARLSGVR